MHPCHSSQHREDACGIGRIVVYLFRQCIIYAKNDICGGTCETIGDLNRSFRSRYLASVNNEKTSFVELND